MAAAVTRHQRGIHVDEWRSVKVPEGWKAELIGGELVVTPAPTMGHAIIAALLAAALQRGEVPDGYIVLPIPVEWEITSSPLVLTATPQPDLVVVERADGKRLCRPPLLAAEVLSPSDRSMLSQSGLTRIEAKRRDYAVGGLADYLEIDRVDDMLLVRRYELHDGELRVVDSATGEERLVAHRPFEYSIRAIDLNP
jgi:Uma2 family endonuclease